MMTADDVKQMLIACLPEGSEDLYDFSSSAGIGKLFLVLSQGLQTFGTGTTETLRSEVTALTMVQKIPDWEGAMGLDQTAIAKFGDTVHRRNQVLGKFRECGTLCIPDTQAAINQFFGYRDASQIQIIECNRLALELLNTYTNNTSTGDILPFSEGTIPIVVPDGPIVTPAGAQAFVTIYGNLEELQFSIQSPDPDRRIVYFPPEDPWPFQGGWLGSGTVAGAQFLLTAPQFSGAKCNGTWYVRMKTGANTAVLNSVSLFVEGYTRWPDGTEGTGSEVFDWVVFADPALLGPNADLVGALRTIRRIKPAHTNGYLAQINAVGDTCAIPDLPQTIPEGCIPC